MNRTVINVISGKGGTGKTLLTCVLADMLGNAPDCSVLVVDLDVFVRGLTSLLYFHREEKLYIARENQLTVSSFFVEKLTEKTLDQAVLAISKYRSFDVVPAVPRIDEILNFQDIAPNNRAEAKKILENLIDSIPNGYRFVILDSRAGYDELIAATHELSDLSICVEEPDPISRVTSDNLVAQLKKDIRTPLFRLTNKARGVISEEDLERENRSVTDLGVIPFDMDVLRSFGYLSFWDQITRSLYRSALAQAWNRLSQKMQLDVRLYVPRFSPVASERLETNLGWLSSVSRIGVLYGALISFMAFGYGLVKTINVVSYMNANMKGLLDPREEIILYQDAVLASGSIAVGLLTMFIVGKLVWHRK